MIVRSTVVFHVDIEVGDNLTPSEAKWRIEENYCIDNVVNNLYAITNKANEEGLCGTCPIGKAFVGEISFDAISKIESDKE